MSALEDQYQIELDEAAITEATTLGDIERIVSRGKSASLPYPYPGWAMRLPMKWIRPVVYQVFLLPLTLIMCRVRVVGIERLAKMNESKPVLFIANHVTDVDAGLILSALPWRQRRRLAIAMSGVSAPLASSAGKSRRVCAPESKSGIRARSRSLQCVLTAATEWVSTEFRVCGRSG